MPKITAFLLTLLAAPMLAGEIEIPSIVVPSVRVSAVRVDDGSMKALIRTWDRRWAAARAAARDAIRVVPHRYSPLGMWKAKLDKTIADLGWTEVIEREWLAYLSALKAAQTRSQRTQQRDSK